MKKNDVSAILGDFLKKELTKEPFLFLDSLFSVFPRAEAFLVGGAIRDIILNRSVKDFDFVVRGVETRELEEFLVTFGKLVYVGKQFGVYKLRPYDADVEIDIALPRREKSKGHGYKEFEIIADPMAPIQEDLTRRDFTINALAFSLKDRICIDEVGGLRDLKARIIRTVGEPSLRFSEDYTRMLRAVRQSIQLDFEIEQKTQDAIIHEARHIIGSLTDFVSSEMISHEFMKSFNCNPLKTITLYDSLGILIHVLPDVQVCKGVEQNIDYHPEGDVYKHILEVLGRLRQKDSTRLKLAALFHDIAKPNTAAKKVVNNVERITFYGHADKGVDVFVRWAKGMNLGESLINDVSFLIRNHLFLWHGDIFKMRVSTIARVFLQNVELGSDLLSLHRMDISYDDERRQEAEGYIDSAKKYIDELSQHLQLTDSKIIIPLTGEDVISHFPDLVGPQIGEYLRRARDYYLDMIPKKSLSKDDLIAYLAQENE